MRTPSSKPHPKVGLHVRFIGSEGRAVFVLGLPTIQTFDISPIGLAGVITQTTLEPEGCRKPLKLWLDNAIQTRPYPKGCALGELFLDACSLTGKLTQVVELRLTDVTATLD